LEGVEECEQLGDLGGVAVDVDLAAGDGREKSPWPTMISSTAARVSVRVASASGSWRPSEWFSAALARNSTTWSLVSENVRLTVIRLPAAFGPFSRMPR
jgi:hypothetical protein